MSAINQQHMKELQRIWMILNEQRLTKINKDKNRNTQRYNDTKTESLKGEKTKRPKNRKKEKQKDRMFSLQVGAGSPYAQGEEGLPC